MKADMSTLIGLCEKADNDVRACLNSLQVRWSLVWEGLDKESVWEGLNGV